MQTLNEVDVTKLTPAANRAARAILQWSARELADRAGIAFSAVHRLERAGNVSEADKHAILAAYRQQGVEIIDDEGNGARLMKAAASPAIAPKQARSSQPAEWLPVVDAQGRPVPLTYDFVFTDERDTVIGQWREEDEAKPMPLAWLKGEVTELAKKITRAHPAEHPWDGWHVTIVATGWRDTPVDMARFSVLELLQP